ncbi:MAG TPA: hypothetical protein VEC93_07510 [Anaerolineae bacterium]|nr:hypothetical protein [Anaerolineae bacterium]
MKKNYPETSQQGQFWRATLLDMDSRLGVAHGIAKTETLASLIVFQTLKRRGHPHQPPPLISDGWGGIDEALIEVYGLVPQYSGEADRQPASKFDRVGSTCKWLSSGMSAVVSKGSSSA